MSESKQFKSLYDFTAYVTREVETEETRTENGSEITVKTKKDTRVPVKIHIKKPTRQEREEADLMQSKYFFHLCDSGLYTKQEMAKKYNDKGGDLSKPEIDLYIELQSKLAILVNEYQRFIITEKGLGLEDYNKKESEFLAKINTIKRELIDFESQRSAIFDHTADNKAFYKLLNWFTVFLSFKEVDGKYEPLFGGKTFEEKLENYDNLIEEGDELVLSIKDKLAAYIAYWWTSGAKTKEDFKPIEDELEGK